VKGKEDVGGNRTFSKRGGVLALNQERKTKKGGGRSEFSPPWVKYQGFGHGTRKGRGQGCRERRRKNDGGFVKRKNLFRVAHDGGGKANERKRVPVVEDRKKKEKNPYSSYRPTGEEGQI